MGKFSRDKGNRVERRMVNMLKESGIPARRVPLSGATEYAKGDVEFIKDAYVAARWSQYVEDPHTDEWAKYGLVAECKARKEFPKWLTEYLGSNDALFLVEDRKEPLVVLPFSIFREIIG
jgi:hypothetical protein